MIIQLLVTNNKPLVNVSLETSFGSKFEPSSNHYVGTDKIETLCIIRMEISSFTLNDTL